MSHLSPVDIFCMSSVLFVGLLVLAGTVWEWWKRLRP